MSRKYGLPPPGFRLGRLSSREMNRWWIPGAVLLSVFGVGLWLIAGTMGMEYSIIWCIAIGPLVLFLPLFRGATREGLREVREADGHLCLTCRYPLMQREDGRWGCPECGESWSHEALEYAWSWTYRQVDGGLVTGPPAREPDPETPPTGVELVRLSPIERHAERWIVAMIVVGTLAGGGVTALLGIVGGPAWLGVLLWVGCFGVAVVLARSLMGRGRREVEASGWSLCLNCRHPTVPQAGMEERLCPECGGRWSGKTLKETWDWTYREVRRVADQARTPGAPPANEAQHHVTQ